MSTFSDLENVVKEFVEDFNEMCNKERKDLLIRETITSYEGSTSVTRHQTFYEYKMKTDCFEIYSRTKGFWIFKQKFPLFTIYKRKGYVDFGGLYTSNFHKIPYSEVKIQLEKYKLKCQDLPAEAFINT